MGSVDHITDGISGIGDGVLDGVIKAACTLISTGSGALIGTTDLITGSGV